MAGAIEETWDAASDQIKTVVDNVVFPALDMILAIAFFVKLGSAYFDYRKGHQFEWAGPGHPAGLPDLLLNSTKIYLGDRWNVKLIKGPHDPAAPRRMMVRPIRE